MPRLLTTAAVTEFRNRLCDAGAQLFAEQGFEGFKMRELANRMGISAMTPYRYFRDKEAIMSEVRVRAFARFADWLETQLSSPDADDNVLGQAYARYAIQEHAQYRLMFDFVQPASADLPALALEEQRIRRVMVAHLRTLTDRGLVSGDPEQLGVLLWSVLHGVTTLYLAGKLSSQDFGHSLSNAVRIFTGCPIEASGLAPETASINASIAPWRQTRPRLNVPAYEVGI